MWMFFTLGLAFAATAVVMYPFFNPGWSSMISFFRFCCLGRVCPGHDSSGSGGRQLGSQGQEGLRGLKRTIFLFRLCVFQIVVRNPSTKSYIITF